MSDYFSKRRHLKYYQYVRELLQRIGQVDVAVDVGAADTDIILSAQARRRIIIEPGDFDVVQGEGVEWIKKTWSESRDDLPGTVDVLTCLQVLEHMPSKDIAQAMAHAFVLQSPHVIVSVPYCWIPGSSGDHKLDPISLMDVIEWFGREPTETRIIQELPEKGYHAAVRLVAYFAWFPAPNKTIYQKLCYAGTDVCKTHKTRVAELHSKFPEP